MSRKKEPKWTAEDIPTQIGKTAIVTGANSGIGYEATRALVQKGAQVVMACRNLEKAEAAAERIRTEFPDARLELIQLDLADLASIRRFADKILEHHQLVHILLNNAGIMFPPKLLTVDGFELQFGTNHLGHFALTGLLLKQILTTKGARIVTMSSFTHRWGKIDFDNLNGEKSYSKVGAYSQSKLANLLFAYELQRKLETSGNAILSLAAHPGWSATNLQATGTKMSRGGWAYRIFLGFGNWVFAQSATMGALPMLYAATAPDVEGGAYYGPGGWRGQRGYPKKAKSSERSHDEDVAKRLWDVSEDLTGVKYNF